MPALCASMRVCWQQSCGARHSNPSHLRLGAVVVLPGSQLQAACTCKIGCQNARCCTLACQGRAASNLRTSHTAHVYIAHSSPHHPQLHCHCCSTHHTRSAARRAQSLEHSSAAPRSTHLLFGSSVRSANVVMKLRPVRFFTRYVGHSKMSFLGLSRACTPVTCSTGRGL